MNNLSTNFILPLIILSGFLALLYGYIARKQILNSKSGNKKMKEVAEAIQIGARAYLNRQYKTISIVGLLVLIIIIFTFSALLCIFEVLNSPKIGFALVIYPTSVGS